MKDFRSIINDNQFLTKVSRVADKLNIETYLIGGFVRDVLLERSLNKDIDIVCIGNGIKLAKAFQSELGKDATLVVYKNFGTAAVSFQDQNIEFVGARKESYRYESRKPIVEDGTLEDDQNRRDFTINALAVSLNQDRLGLLIDPFDGKSDLKKKLIKTPLNPEITFSDDPLRIMRAIRFATQLNFDIETSTYESIVKMIPRLEIVSQERITDELNKIIMSDKPSYGFKLLFHSGLLELIFPEMHNLQGVIKKEGKVHKDNFYHTLQVLDNTARNSNNLWLRWAAILHDIAKPATQRFNEKVGWTFHGHEDMGAKWVPRIFKNLRLPQNEKMKYVQKLVRLHLRPIALVNEKVTDSAVRRLIFEAGDIIDDLMILCRADITSKNNYKVKSYLSNFAKVERKILEVEEKDKIRDFQPPISGEEIMKLFGVGPSKIIGDIKEEIKESILEGVIKNNKKEAYELMLKIADRNGLIAK